MEKLCFFWSKCEYDHYNFLGYVLLINEFIILKMSVNHMERFCFEAIIGSRGYKRVQRLQRIKGNSYTTRILLCFCVIFTSIVLFVTPIVLFIYTFNIVLFSPVVLLFYFHIYSYFLLLYDF